MSQTIEIISGDGGDEPPCLETGNPRFGDLVMRRLNRRDVLAGGLAAAVAALFRPGDGRAANRLDFKPVPVSRADSVGIPEGYRVQFILPWGEPILGRMPAFAVDNSGEDQAMQVGSHHDGVHFFAIDGRADDGLLVINHEYVEPRLMHVSASGLKLGPEDAYLIDGRRPADDVLKEMNAHGVSIVGSAARPVADGRVADPRNRRITALTPMELGGPVRGSNFVENEIQPRRHLRARYAQQLCVGRDTMEHISCRRGPRVLHTCRCTRRSLQASIVAVCFSEAISLRMRRFGV